MLCVHIDRITRLDADIEQRLDYAAHIPQNLHRRRSIPAIASTSWDALERKIAFNALIIHLPFLPIQSAARLPSPPHDRLALTTADESYQEASRLAHNVGVA